MTHMTHIPIPPARPLIWVAAALLLAGCSGGGWDLRGGTGTGAEPMPVTPTDSRPQPDSRGVIAYPGYSVLVANGNETLAEIAARLGINAEQLATLNGLPAGYRPRPGEVLLLPGGVPAVSGDIEVIAAVAIDNASGTATPGPVTTANTAQPVRHRVERGETAYSIARIYDVSVKSLADWNGLDAEYTVREGQTLLIPVAAPEAPASLMIEPEPVAPGAGSPTPVPPSARNPLPAAGAAAGTSGGTPAPASPDLGQYETSASEARLAMPVSGDILRDYDKAAGREGIDIAAAPGTPVMAADDGVVALVSRSVEGDTIVLIRHAGNLNTVYDNVTVVTVEKGQTVRRGQTIGQVAQGDPQVLRFGVGIGTESTDPLPYLQ